MAKIKVKPSPILKNKVRILRPNEYKLIESEILKMHHKVMLQALLFSGMRFIELKRLKIIIIGLMGILLRLVLVQVLTKKRLD